MIAATIAFVPVAIWTLLVFGRGGFWRGRERDDAVAVGELQRWPSVVAVIPARDEKETIARCLTSLLGQDYPGRFAIVVVDDQSSDGTSQVARATAPAADASGRVRVLTGTDLPQGWTGKLWAMRQGLAALESGAAPPELLLFTDADIAYGPRALRRLVAIAEARGCVLASLMVKLRCDSVAERWLTPAFVFFLKMLYPFAWVNDPRRAMAAAAGGCMLVRREALASAGGLEALRNALIDDCALAALMKRQGAIWLGLTERAESLRAYPRLADFRRMVARSAFAQLRYSALLLAGAVAGMLVTYVGPPLFAAFGDGPARAEGFLAWTLMVWAYAPTLRLYRLPAFFGVALPAVASAYTMFTIDSALQYWRGRGGYWKGRFQASMSRM